MNQIVNRQTHWWTDSQIDEPKHADEQTVNKQTHCWINSKQTSRFAFTQAKTDISMIRESADIQIDEQACNRRLWTYRHHIDTWWTDRQHIEILNNRRAKYKLSLQKIRSFMLAQWLNVGRVPRLYPVCSDCDNFLWNLFSVRNDKCYRQDYVQLLHVTFPFVISKVTRHIDVKSSHIVQKVFIIMSDYR